MQELGRQVRTTSFAFGLFLLQADVASLFFGPLSPLYLVLYASACPAALAFRQLEVIAALTLGLLSP